MFLCADGVRLSSQVRLQSAKTGHYGPLYCHFQNDCDVPVVSWWIDLNGDEVPAAPHNFLSC